jgi:O-methyltransferase involved in polyketide biosynthesis
MAIGSRNYNTISPSAAFLLQLKAYTDIPFAKEAAELMEKEESVMAKYIRDAGVRQFFRWLLHFENRYRSIQQLLSDNATSNILELSSGYSFRGLDMCREHSIHFIDTDLPGLIAFKQGMINNMAKDIVVKGKLELLPLNALDENAFHEMTGHFADGPVSIINEGLLMYLDKEEKIQLCNIIRNVLQSCGGRWITADIYVREKDPAPDILDTAEYVQQFRQEHHIEENKFETYEEAEAFFTSCGFTVNRRLAWTTTELSCLRYLDEEKRKEVLDKIKNGMPRNQAWELVVE